MESSSHPRVVVGVDQTIAGYAALRAAVCQARARRVPLYALRAAPAIFEDVPGYILEAFAEALGGVPGDLEVHIETSTDNAAAALARSACDPRDLIVVGNDGKGALRAACCGSVGRSLLKRARCPMIIIPAPEMQSTTRRSARKLASGRSDVWDRFESEAPELRGRPYQGA